MGTAVAAGSGIGIGSVSNNNGGGGPHGLLEDYGEAMVQGDMPYMDEILITKSTDDDSAWKSILQRDETAAKYIAASQAPAVSVQILDRPKPTDVSAAADNAANDNNHNDSTNAETASSIDTKIGHVNHSDNGRTPPPLAVWEDLRGFVDISEELEWTGMWASTLGLSFVTGWPVDLFCFIAYLYHRISNECQRIPKLGEKRWLQFQYSAVVLGCIYAVGSVLSFLFLYASPVEHIDSTQVQVRFLPFVAHLVSYIAIGCSKNNYTNLSRYWVWLLIMMQSMFVFFARHHPDSLLADVCSLMIIWNESQDVVLHLWKALLEYRNYHIYFQHIYQAYGDMNFSPRFIAMLKHHVPKMKHPGGEKSRPKAVTVHNSDKVEVASSATKSVAEVLHHPDKKNSSNATTAEPCTNMKQQHPLLQLFSDAFLLERDDMIFSNRGKLHDRIDLCLEAAGEDSVTFSYALPRSLLWDICPQGELLARPVVQVMFRPTAHQHGAPVMNADSYRYIVYAELLGSFLLSDLDVRVRVNGEPYENVFLDLMSKTVHVRGLEPATAYSLTLQLKQYVSRTIRCYTVPRDGTPQGCLFS